ncbi:uncharacterized protein LOC131294830 [Anopheles ziemanni]|uniref:uncharacterized protein LOC131265392 n=1 Tax=Anopheles coustani TaxID=139045 RepID=UPI00265912B8|nr:uncharacterized protein LOC131265392 [Anopheles coustani]XP_058178860.1 uncharacterized protein LOC131294830 [Anopheles ziemanni]
MSAYIVIPVVVLTVMAIWFLVYMYDKRFKNPLVSIPSSRPATTCPNIRQEGIVYTISNANGTPPANSANNTVAYIQHQHDGRTAPPPYGYTNQNLVVVTSIPRDFPPSYEQVVTSREESNNNPSA